MIYDDRFEIDELINAWHNDSLVFFVGSGVSVNSGLPSFWKLSIDLAKKATKYDDYFEKDQDDAVPKIKTKSELTLDKVLEHISKGGSPVNKWIDDIFDIKNTNLKYKVNSFHKLIVNIASANGRTPRIITTNYDHCLSKCLDSYKDENKMKLSPYKRREFISPALPQGTDFQGIAYIHGKAGYSNNGKDLVVTSSDFGKAYLTSAYVARFLEQIFRTYRVCFIGYSGDDVIVDRFAQGLDDKNKHFAIAHERYDEWKYRNINVIKYSKATDDLKHKELGELLEYFLDMATENQDTQIIRMKDIVFNENPNNLEVNNPGKLKYLSMLLKKNDITLSEYHRINESEQPIQKTEISKDFNTKVWMLNSLSEAIINSQYFNDWLNWIIKQNPKALEYCFEKNITFQEYYTIPFSEIILSGLISSDDAIYNKILSIYIRNNQKLNDKLIFSFIERVLINDKRAGVNSIIPFAKNINDRSIDLLCTSLIPQIDCLQKHNRNHWHGFRLEDLKWEGNEDVIAAYLTKLFEPQIVYENSIIGDTVYPKISQLYSSDSMGKLFDFVNKNKLNNKLNKKFYKLIMALYNRKIDFIIADKNSHAGYSLFITTERLNNWNQEIENTLKNQMLLMSQKKIEEEIYHLVSSNLNVSIDLGLEVLIEALKLNKLQIKRKHIEKLIDSKCYVDSYCIHKTSEIMKLSENVLTKSIEEQILSTISRGPFDKDEKIFYSKNPDEIERWKAQMLINYSGITKFKKIQLAFSHHKEKYPEIYPPPHKHEDLNEYKLAFLNKIIDKNYAGAVEEISDIEWLKWSDSNNRKITQTTSGFHRQIDDFCNWVQKSKEIDSFELADYIIDNDLYNESNYGVYSQIVNDFVSSWQNVKDNSTKWNYSNIVKKLSLFKKILEESPSNFWNYIRFVQDYLKIHFNSKSAKSMVQLIWTFWNKYVLDTEDMGFELREFYIEETLRAIMIRIWRKCNQTETFNASACSARDKEDLDKVAAYQNEVAYNKLGVFANSIYAIYPELIVSILTSDSINKKQLHTFYEGLFTSGSISSDLRMNDTFKQFICSHAVQIFCDGDSNVRTGLLNMMLSDIVFKNNREYRMLFNKILIEAIKDASLLKDYYNAIIGAIDTFSYNKQYSDLRKYWNKFYKDFISKRLKDDPVIATDYEHQRIIFTIPRLGKFFHEATDLLKDKDAINLQQTSLSMHVREEELELIDAKELLFFVSWLLQQKGVDKSNWAVKGFIKDVMKNKRVMKQKEYKKIETLVNIKL